MNSNNGTPKYVIKSCLSPYQKSPASNKQYSRKMLIPKSSINANKKKQDLKLSFTRCIHSVSDEPTIAPITLDTKIRDIQNHAASVIQLYMKSYFQNHENDNFVK